VIIAIVARREISASTGSDKEIAGLKKNDDYDDYDVTKIAKSRKREFSSGELRAHRKSLGIHV
jgi:hypothetical protein